MSRSAFMIGETGQIGRAVAAKLLDDGWDVTLGSRDRGSLPDDLLDQGARTIELDRSDPKALSRALGSGTDLLLDLIGYEPSDAAQLLMVQDDVSQIVTVSSASVYCDAKGRTLDEARRSGFPDFPMRITEDQPTVLPGPETYSTRKVAVELTLLEGARIPAAVLRPCAIHGPHSQHPREWWFVKRLIDGRRHIPLVD